MKSFMTSVILAHIQVAGMLTTLFVLSTVGCSCVPTFEGVVGPPMQFTSSEDAPSFEQEFISPATETKLATNLVD